MRRVFPLFALLLPLLLIASGGAAPAGAGQEPSAPRRVVSINLCADQLVLALADRGQIAALTQNAADPAMSAAAAEARGLPRLGISAEELLASEPDLFVGHSAALGALAAHSFTAVDVPPAQNYAEIVATIRRTAGALGHRERGEALIARMDRELAAIPRRGRGRVAAYYQRRGFLTGTGTLVDEIMRRAGLVNLATRLGKPALAQVSLEEIVAARPDFLIVESDSQRVTDQGTEMLHHPALRHIPRISIPQAWTVCGGPAYVRAVRAIARQIGT